MNINTINSKMFRYCANLRYTETVGAHSEYQSSILLHAHIIRTGIWQYKTESISWRNEEIWNYQETTKSNYDDPVANKSHSESARQTLWRIYD
jgi:hypothetical protein